MIEASSHFWSGPLHLPQRQCKDETSQQVLHLWVASLPKDVVCYLLSMEMEAGVFCMVFSSTSVFLSIRLQDTPTIMAQICVIYVHCTYQLLIIRHHDML